MRRFNIGASIRIRGRPFLCIALVMMFMAAALATLPTPLSGGTTDTFSNGNSSLELSFPNGGGEATVYVKVPVGVQVQNGSLSMRGDKIPNERSFRHASSSEFGTGQMENVTTASTDIAYLQRNPMGGRLAPMATYPAGDGPHYLAIGDLNGDGLNDLALSNRYSNNTGIFYQNAGGTLNTMVPLPVGGSPNGIAIGDVNGDGRKDLVVAWLYYNLSGAVSIFYQTGTGQLSAAADLEAGNYPDGLALGDLNKDGRLDIAVADWLDAAAGVLIQIPDPAPVGQFYKVVPYSVGNGPRGVAIGDINNDGRDDLVATSYLDNRTAIIYQTSGGQLQQPTISMDSGFLPVGVAIGDVNGDGRSDVVVANSRGNSTTLYYQRPDGTLLARTDVHGSDSWPWGVATGDINNDMRGDFVVSNYFNNTDKVDVFAATATQTAPQVLRNLDTGAGSGPDGVAVGDLNNDGLSDIAVANNRADTIGIFAQQAYAGIFTSSRVPAPLNISFAKAKWHQLQKGAPVKVELSNDDGASWTEAANETQMEFGTAGSVLRYRVTFASASILLNITVNYTLETLYPSDLALDVGADGSTEWSMQGILMDEVTLPDLSAPLTAYVAAHPLDADPDGNLSIPLRVTSTTAGMLNLTAISVTFNHPPEITSYTPRSPPFNVNEGQSQLFTVNATDAEGQVLTYQWLLDGTDAGASDRTFTYSPDFNASGSHNITVVVSDGFSNASNNWEMRVKNVNRAPQLSEFSPPGEVTMREGSSQQFHAMASDPDLDDLTVDWLIDGTRLKTETEGDASFGYHPGFGDAGAHNLTLRASDGELAAARSWNITVTAVNPLIDLVLSAPADTNVSVDEGASQNFSVDTAGLKQVMGNITVKWTLDGNQTGTEAEYIFSPGYLSSGQHMVAVRVQAMGSGLSFARAWKVTVTETNDPPEILSATPGFDPPVKEGAKQVFSVSVRDPDNNTLAIKWYLNGTEVGTGESYTYAASYTSEGRYTVMVTVSDGKVTLNRTWQMTVVHAAKPAPSGGIDQGLLLGVVAVVVVMAALGGVGFYVYRKRESLSEALDHVGGEAAAAPAAAPAAPPPPKFEAPKLKPKATYPCPNCGQPAEEDWMICHHCDSQLKENAPVTSASVTVYETRATEEALARAKVSVDQHECPKCGKMLDPSVENCPTCGEYVWRAGAPSMAPTVVLACPSCGQPIEEGWIKCPECGAQLGPAPAGQEQPPAGATAPPEAAPAPPAAPAAPAPPTTGAPVEANPICLSCGATMQAGSDKCPKCGAENK